MSANPEICRGRLRAWEPAYGCTRAREEAAARYLRISGLAGLLPAADPAVDAGLVEQGGRWRLAMDPGRLVAGPGDPREIATVMAGQAGGGA